MPKILVVDDDAHILRMLARALRYEGFDVETAPDAETALRTFRRGGVSLVLLDVVLPDADGVSLIAEFRAVDPDVPVLLVTARNAVPDRVHGLMRGADDYVVKPFHLEELLARVRSNLRKAKREDGDVLRVGDLEVDVARRAVRRGGRHLELTPREFELLLLFLRHPGRVLAKGEILARVWGHDAEVDENVVEVYVAQLRQKTEQGGAPRLIHTVRGVGYVLRAPESGAGGGPSSGITGGE
ncbi:MAG: Two-component response regulator [Brockia lithotrophica]|uniref:Two-component response regulator n=1 Tax=Brockia lithotrophica TaxID=933949 RepID=A0A2T5GAH5_9BACL|nr:response regulator transcription factor [Brockia lithotrophica]PTQ53189.1 MAG: Two-component response regulator [Brockia lithotrophica]